jgi:hypothetical protein
VPAGIHGLPDRSLATDCNAVMTSSATRIDGLGGQAADKGIDHGTNPRSVRREVPRTQSRPRLTNLD